MNFNKNSYIFTLKSLISLHLKFELSLLTKNAD